MTSVVASMAIHIRPTWLASSIVVIEPRNANHAAPKRRAFRRVSWPLASWGANE